MTTNPTSADGKTTGDGDRSGASAADRSTGDGAAEADDSPAGSTGDRPSGAASLAPSADPLTIVFFDGSPPSYGGGSEMLRRLLTRLDPDAFEPVLLTQRRDELCRRLDAEETGSEVAIEVVPFPGSLDSYGGSIRDQPPHRLLGTAGRLLQYDVRARRVLKRADVLWCINLRSVLTVGPYAALSSTPVVWNVGLGRPSEGIQRYMNELGLRLADRVFVESEHQAGRLFTDAQLARHGDAFRIFPKGIDVDRFSPEREAPPLSDGEVAIGTAASITPRKGVETFVEAAIELLDRRADRSNCGTDSSASGTGLRFQIAGEPPHESDEPYERRLRRRVAESGHADAIEFLGWVEDVPAFYDRLDAFVLPSRNEGVPGVVREALAAELPVVATDVGGTREAVRDGETGILVEPGDASRLAGAIRALLDDPDAAREMATAGRELVEQRFAVETYVARHETMLAEVGR